MPEERCPVDSDFKRWLVNAKMRRPKTADQYAYGVRLVSEFFYPRSLQYLSTSDLLDYTHSLQPSGSLRNLRRIALVAYYEYLGVMPNPASGLPSWKHQSRMPRALTTEEARLLLKVAWNHSEFYGFLVSLLLFTGIRISEALSLQWADVFENRAYIVQKGGQQRVVWLSKSCAGDLGRWRTVAPKTKYVFSSPTLLARGRDAPLPRQTAWSRIREFGAEIGIEDFHPHLTRHTVGVDVARETNGNVLAVMEILGHANVQSSMPYIRALGQNAPALLNNLSYSRNESA